MSIDKSMFDRITWDMAGIEIERESLRRIESEAGEAQNKFTKEEWRVARRLVHTTANFSLLDSIKFKNNPIEAGLNAMKNGAVIYSDSNMIRSGLSVPKLQKFNESYTRESIKCFIADPEIAQIAKEKNISRALASVEKAKSVLDGAIVLIGNAPLALAGIIKLISEGTVKPALIIGMPVGFVNVVESKELLFQTDIPYISIEGRVGGSPIAVATLHGIMESGF